MATCRLVHKTSGVFGQQEARFLQLTHDLFDPLYVRLMIAVALFQRRTGVPVRQALYLGLGKGHIRALAIAKLGSCMPGMSGNFTPVGATSVPAASVGTRLGGGSPPSVTH